MARRSRTLMVWTLAAVLVGAAGGTTCVAGPSVAAESAPQPAFDLWLRDPHDITAGPDGNLWFTEPKARRIGRITPAGEVTEFSDGLRAESSPSDITVGPDGNLWFTDPGALRIGRITTAGTIKEFPARTKYLAGIAAGPDGNLWFGKYYPGRIARITPAGVVTDFSKGIDPSTEPSHITAGPDGNIWFTDIVGIGRVTPRGDIREFPLPGSENPGLSGIAAGADGNVWFTEYRRGGIGRITPAGRITEFSSGLRPRADVGPNGIAAAPDGTLWFSAHYWSSAASHGGFGFATPGGRIMALPGDALVRPVLPPGVDADRVAWGSDGNLWFTEVVGQEPGQQPVSAHRIGRMSPDGVVTEFPPAPVLATIQQRGTREIAVGVRCPTGSIGSCDGVLRLLARPTADGRTMVSRRLTLAGGEQREVIVPLWTAGRRRLESTGGLSVGVALQIATDDAALRAVTLRTTAPRPARRVPTFAGTWSLLPPPSSMPDISVDGGVWADGRMIVFGFCGPWNGCSSRGESLAAISYTPATGTWRRLEPPAQRGNAQAGARAVWTGKEMLVAGGANLAYNPTTNRWRRIPPVPSGILVWTGREMIGWGGGCCGDSSDEGAAYNPETRTLRSLPEAPLRPKQEVIGAWTGRELVIVGGGDADGDHFSDAAAYNPTTNAWRRIRPMPARLHGAVWTGREVILMGRGGVGLAYDPRTDRWRGLRPVGPTVDRDPWTGHQVWTGRCLLSWGGEQRRGDGSMSVPRGLAHCPASNRVSLLPPAPVGGQGVSVWTGRQLIVWGEDHQLGDRVINGAVFTPRNP